MSVETLVVTRDEEGMRLDRWFKHRAPAFTLSHLNKIIRTGQVRVDGGRAKISTRVSEGQKIRIPPIRDEQVTESEAPSRARAAALLEDRRAIESMILFEDRGLMVLNKPYGLAVQGGSGTYHHIDGMLDAFMDDSGNRPRLVHRLDRDTSGVLLVAKTRKMAADLGAVFRSRQARKVYWALVEGVPKPAQGRISLFLAKGEAMGDARAGRKPPSAPERAAAQERMRVARHGEEDAQHSVTYYTIVDKVLPRLAWLSMKPITGRTHQLRAHAEAIGHPIVGDPKYNGGTGPDPRRLDPLRAIPDGVERKLHLLARRLVLPNPSGGILDVTAPLPPHMQASWDLFGFDAKQFDPIDEAPEE